MSRRFDAAKDRLLARSPVRARRCYLYWRTFGYATTFRHPVTFNEKSNWRILNDHRPEIGLTSDKLASKELAARSAQVAPLLWWGTDLAEFAAMTLPDRWVLKPNHRAGGIVHFGAGKPDLKQLKTLTKGWMFPEEAAVLGEWAFTQARPGFLAEERLGDGTEAPADYKFFVFDGEVTVVQVDVGRFSGHQRRFYTADWQPLNDRLTYPLAEIQPPPDHLGEMVDLAERLGKPYDFIRVDLYDTADGVFFGELGACPGGGLEPFTPPSRLDEELGAKWTLPTLA